jgi:WD40 repeat protein
MDCKLCVYSIAQFVSVRPVWVLPIPADSITSASQNYSTVALRHRRHVDVWALNPPSPASSSEGKNKSKIKNTSKGKGSEKEKGASSPALLLRVRLESPEHIHCMSLSPDGNLLVISGAFGTKLWHLKQKESDPSVLKPVPVALPAKARVYCHAATFSGDSTQLALSTAKGSILLVKIAAERGDEGSGEGSAKKDKKKRKNKGQASSDGAAASNGSAAGTCGYSASLNHTLPHAETVAEASSGLGRAVSRLSLSPDGMFLAVAACDRGVCVYELDRSSLYWRLPVTSTAGHVASVAFHASDPSRLVLLYSVGGYCVYHLDSMKITDCSIHALRNRSASASDGDDVSASSSSSGDSRLAKLMSKVSGSLHGFCFDSSSAERLYAFGQGVCMLVDTAAGAGVPKKAKSVYPTLFDDDDDASTAISGGGGGGGGDEAGRKRKRGGSDASASSSSSSSSNFACITSYRSIIHLGCADGHLVSAPTPFLSCVALPCPALPCPAL